VESARIRTAPYTTGAKLAHIWPVASLDLIGTNGVVRQPAPAAIRAYCDAVEARHGNDAIAADPEAAQWLALARERASRAQQLPRMPADPEITHEALKPYLGGWSPYGPRGW